MTFLRTISFAAVLAFATTNNAHALEAYSATEQKAFMDWCTMQETNSESLCSCALKRVAQTVPATALSSYLASLSSGQSMSFSALATTTASTTALSVTQSLSACSN